MRLLLSFAALLLSVVFLQISSGGVGPLDALSGLALGFSRAEVGLLGSAHFLGFFVGCWWAPRLMGTVGHARAFAAFAAAGAMGLLGHTLIHDAAAWAVMRIASGACVAGCYTVIEAWLNDRLTNETRGRMTGAYRVVDMGASLVGQLLISVLEPVSYVSYNLLALICCASLFPLTLTKSQMPETPRTPRLRPNLAWSRSPLAVAAVVVAGLTSASFRMVGPIYGQEVGLRVDQIAYFLAAFVLGGAIAQLPVGWLADKYDRRWVLIGLSGAAVFSCLVTVGIGAGGTIMVMFGAGFFGLTTFPIYSVAASHAHDFAASHERVELSAALMFFFAVGAIASPIVTSQLIELFGPPALFIFLSIGHVLLIVFGGMRMLKGRSVGVRTPYVYAPRTSFTIGRLLKRERDNK
ncbi:MAG: MFS transporter [Halocynthiibacter sp.]